MDKEAAKPWFVYMLRCSDNTLYTGITIDVFRREQEHNNSNLGAKYTRTRQPVNVVYQETQPSRSEAAKREHAIKKMTKAKKEKMIAKYSTET